MRRALLPTALLTLVLAGCGETKIDAAEGERSIRKTVEQQLGAQVKSVSCPEGLTARKGETFDCTVTGADGTEGDAVVTMKDDEGNVDYDAPFLNVGNLEREIRTAIKEQAGFDATVDCPEIIVGEKGGVFECDSASGGDERTVQVTQQDDQGNVRFELV